MSDPLELYGRLHGLLIRLREDAASAWKVGLLIGVAAVVAGKVVFAWVGGSISGAEAIVLLVGLLVSEAAAVKWVGDFAGVHFALLLLLPLAVWAGLEVIARVGGREAFRSTVRIDIRRFRDALRRDPRNTAAHILLGDAHLKLGKPAVATAEYRAALALAPRSYEVRYKLQRAERLAAER
jgi:tetratricopeptide (TPR) repeat protein